MVGPGGADALDVAQFGQLHKSSIEICTKQKKLLDHTVYSFQLEGSGICNSNV